MNPQQQINHPRSETDYAQELTNVRMDAIGQRLDTFLDDFKRVPTEVDRKVDALKESISLRLDALDETIKQRHNAFERYVEEKFTSVGNTFGERTALRTALFDANNNTTKVAIDLMKEGIQEIKVFFSREIDSLNVNTDKRIENLNANTDKRITTLDGKISDQKDRITSIEGKSTGMGMLWSIGMTAVMAMIAIGSLVFAVTKGGGDAISGNVRGSAAVLTVPATPDTSGR